MNFVSDPTYLESLNFRADEFGAVFLSYWMFEGPHVNSMSALARRTAARHELGRTRLGFITLMAQAVPQTSVDAPPGMPVRRAQFEVSSDILAIAAEIAASESDHLQIARTCWQLGELAFERYLPDLSTAFFARAAQTYVARRRWQEVAVLYSKLGLSEAGAGHGGVAIGWLSLSEEVSRSLNDAEGVDSTTSLADAIKQDPSRFFAPALQMKDLLSSGASTSGNAVLAEVYGLGVVAVSAIIPTVVAALQMADSFGDTLLTFVDQGWPKGAIAAAAVDIQIISRILARPELLDQLEPRAFEVLVATLFEGFGAEVELTKQTRDSGYDVGVTFEVGDLRFRILIEAKKWHQERRVGIATVDRLIGVKHRLKADKVVLVTTSTFSSVARHAAAQMRSEIELVDRGGLNEWVQQYLLPAGNPLPLPSLRIDVDTFDSESEPPDETKD